MAYYVPKYKGYIADAANIVFKRCDGKVYSCTEATATSLTPSGDSLTINGGQGLFPLAFIDSSRGLDASFTNAAFDADMFEITNAVNAVDGDSCTYETRKYEVTTGNKVELPFEVDVTTVYVRGLELTTGDTAAAGKFTAKVEEKKTTISFNNTDMPVGTEVFISYNRRIANAHEISITTNTGSARGEVWYHFPLYSSGTDCTESAVKGWLHVHVYRVRVTTPVPIDTSYKTAATFPVTFSSIDPQRPDMRMYDVTYEPLTTDGSYDTNYGTSVTYH